MKRKTVFGIMLLISLTLVTGCSFNVKQIAKYNPFKGKAQTEVNQASENGTKSAPVKSREEVARDITVIVDLMVRDINDGFLDKAITAGEEGYVIASKPEYSVKPAATVKPVATQIAPATAVKPVAAQTAAAAAVKPKNSRNRVVKAAANQTPVAGAVYDPYGLEATKEKLYEVLVDAYDYKNHLTGLSKEEKEKYVRTARAHYDINPNDVFKKHALAKVLLETGYLDEGIKLATEAYDSNKASTDFMETYAWGLYQVGKKSEAYNLYKTFWTTVQVGTLTQLYHSGVVIEEQDKLAGLSIYKACEQSGYNLMVLEPNVNNLSTQSYINKIISESKKAVDRLLAGGLGVDSQFNYAASERLIHSIVRL